MTNTLATWFKRMPAIAILRGIRPDEAVSIGESLLQAGIGIIEVPLNSPEPLRSIKHLAEALGDRCIIGAGTVLSVADVEAVALAGGRISISPNTDTAVIQRSLELGLEPMPGWGTASEAFSACQAGARYLKLFPAATYGPGHIKALKAVLPAESQVLAVGGVGADGAAEWLRASAAGFGIGTELYQPGFTPAQVAERAGRVVAAIRTARALNQEEKPA